MNIWQTGIVALLGLTFAAPAAADSDWSISGNIGITNDYVFRGFSQTNEDFAVQGGLDISHASGFYSGVWASNVEFLDNDGTNSTSVEIDLYAGYGGEFGSIFSYDIAAIYYAYPGDPAGANSDYWEFGATLGVDIGRVRAGVGLWYSPDFFGGTGDALHIPLTLDVPIPLGNGPVGLSFSGDVAFNELLNTGATWDGATSDYFNWSLGFTVTIEDWFDVDLRYHDTDLNGVFCKDLCDERFTVKVSRSL
ncbi:MAG: TorF family putative porin [Alphaproteobacteria bacterium]